MKQRAKRLIKRAFKLAGLKVSLYKKQKLNSSSLINSKSKYNIAEEELYLPTYSPWSKNAKNEFAELMKLIQAQG